MTTDPLNGPELAPELVELVQTAEIAPCLVDLSAQPPVALPPQHPSAPSPPLRYSGVWFLGPINSFRCPVEPCRSLPRRLPSASEGPSKLHSVLWTGRMLVQLLSGACFAVCLGLFLSLALSLSHLPAVSPFGLPFDLGGCVGGMPRFQIYTRFPLPLS